MALANDADSLVELVRRLRIEGVTEFKIWSEDNNGQKTIEIKFAPEFVQRPSWGAEGVPAEDSNQFDPNKCSQCQRNPIDGMLPGLCRTCSLSEAGVAS